MMIMKKIYIIPTIYCSVVEPSVMVATSVALDKTREIESDGEIGVKESRFDNYDVWDHSWNE